MTIPKAAEMIRVRWKNARLTEARYAMTADGLTVLIDDVLENGQPSVLEVYHSDPSVPPQQAHFRKTGRR